MDRYPLGMNVPFIQRCIFDAEDTTIQVNRDDRQTVDDDWGRGQGVQGQGMEDEVENPAGYLLATFSPSVLGLAKLGKSTCNQDMFMVEWFVFPPFDRGPLPTFPTRAK